MHLKFTKPLSNCDYYLILYNNIIIGNIYIQKNIITDINIDGYCFNLVKNVLIKQFLSNIGKDVISLRCNKKYKEYFLKLGFKNTIKNVDDKLILRYEI